MAPTQFVRVPMPAQQPLQASRNRPMKTTLDIDYKAGWIYTTSFSLGIPPQPFTAAIDLNWSDLFVPSTSCLDHDREEYCKPHPLYNSSASSTHTWDGRNTSLRHTGFFTKGNAVSDTLQVGSPSIEVKDQMFEAAYMFRPTYFFDDDWYDAALGLSLETVRGSDSDLQVHSPFQNMMRQQLLENNTFALTLPRNSMETGRLVLGSKAPPEKHTGDKAAMLPLASARHTNISGGWEVEAVSLGFGSFKHPLKDHRAIFSTITPLFDFPEDFVKHIRNELGTDISDGTVDCAKLNEALPKLKVTLQSKAGPVDFVVHPEEYISRELKMPFIDPERCIVPIAEGEASKYITLGSLFLRNFESVFDADDRSVTLLRRSSSHTEE